MSGSPSVIVNKGGFLSSLVRGVFGTIMVVVICGTALGLYGMRMVNGKADMLVENGVRITERLLEALPEWQKAMPPQVADALVDRRAPDYRDQVEVTARVVNDRGNDVVVVEVTNHGDEIISMLPLRVVMEDSDGVPIMQESVYAVSPVQICDEWPGPLWPNSGPRKIKLADYRFRGVHNANATVEITDLRVAMAVEVESQAPAVEAPSGARALAEGTGE